VVTIARSAIAGILEEATTRGAATGVLSVPEPADRSAVFDAVRDTFPLCPPLIGSRSWDTASDSL
jgi:hypothetical protein